MVDFETLLVFLLVATTLDTGTGHFSLERGKEKSNIDGVDCPLGGEH